MIPNCHWVILLILLLISSTPSSIASQHFNPYAVLGLPQSASSDEIKCQYRKLCLLYHPDKNVHRSAKDRKKYEDKFKSVQKANALIGDEETRRQYDQSLVASFPHQHRSQSYNYASEQTSSSTDYYNDILRRYYQQQQRSKPVFTFGGVDMSNYFTSGSAAWMPRTSSVLKSRYVQKVKIPLQDLYNGRYGVDLILKDNLWNRYSAAFRGGVASTLLYQTLMVSVSMMRVVRFPWWILIGAVCFHMGLPKPTKLDYIVDLQAGWKAGTKLVFSEVERGFDIEFILEEEKHKTYHRIGNNLHARVTISEMERRNGCTVKLPSLHKDEESLSINLKANQIRQPGQIIVISGMGWPGRKGKHTGDLFLSVEVNDHTRTKPRRREAHT